MRGRHRRVDMQRLPSLAQSQSSANHSSSRSPMALKFLIALCEAWRTASVPNSQLHLDSVLPMVRRWRNPKALHLVKQCGALQTESGSCSPRTSELPIGTLASGENFSTDPFFKRRICNLLLCLQRLAALQWRWFEDSIIGKNYAARDVVLQLSNVAGPAMTNQGARDFLRDGFDCFVHGRGKLLNEVFHEFGDIGFPLA